MTSAGHYSSEPTGHYLRARVLLILYSKYCQRVQNPHPPARFLLSRRSLKLPFISSKAGRKKAEEFVNLHLISIMQGKTSFLQIAIHSFLPFFHRVYIFLFCWPFQLNLSFNTLFTIQFRPCYLGSVFGPLSIGPIAIALFAHVAMGASYNSHSALRITNTSARIDNGTRLWSAHTVLNTFTRS